MHKGDGLMPFKRNDEIRGDVYKLTTLHSSDGWERLIQ
jgi:hypothetical protein